MTQTLRIGTRGSPLALVQANMVKAALCKKTGLDDDAVTIVPIKTTGDKVQDRPLAEIGGKALWTKELDRAMMEGDIDCSVHSMKDVETIRPANLVIAAMLPRADIRDRLIGAENIDALPERARIGTSSPRRAAQLLALRPDLLIETLRGNVATRLEAVRSGNIDATLLAAAGLERLGYHDVGAPLEIETLLPAPQQGAIGIESMIEHDTTRALIATIDHAPTNACICAERAFLYPLGADCHSPVGANARIDGEAMVITAQLLTNDGRETIADTITAPVGEGTFAAETLAKDLLGRASETIRALFAG